MVLRAGALMARIRTARQASVIRFGIQLGREWKRLGMPAEYADYLAREMPAGRLTGRAFLRAFHQ